MAEALDIARKLSVNERDFYLSRAGSLLNEFGLTPSPFESFMVAASLADSGRLGESIRFYERAAESDDPFDRATSRRALGRARILTGQIERGRGDLLASADDFKVLEGVPGYDPDRMRGEVAESYAQLTSMLTNGPC